MAWEHENDGFKIFRKIVILKTMHPQQCNLKHNLGRYYIQRSLMLSPFAFVFYKTPIIARTVFKPRLFGNSVLVASKSSTPLATSDDLTLHAQKRASELLPKFEGFPRKSPSAKYPQTPSNEFAKDYGNYACGFLLSHHPAGHRAKIQFEIHHGATCENRRPAPNQKFAIPVNMGAIDMDEQRYQMCENVRRGANKSRMAVGPASFAVSLVIYLIIYDYKNLIVFQFYFLNGFEANRHATL